MDIACQTISLPQWSPIIEEHLSSDEPIVNLADGGPEPARPSVPEPARTTYPSHT